MNVRRWLEDILLPQEQEGLLSFVGGHDLKVKHDKKGKGKRIFVLARVSGGQPVLVARLVPFFVSSPSHPTPFRFLSHTVSQDDGIEIIVLIPILTIGIGLEL
ncbi:hypothetical protein VNO78_03651 [Psophocarpus tetragonolobus]|uniref:Uncharacterized protein n=1 Tax=Psophocarpus tetragonolobus TaxID=3891 RepID=A0AAN9XW44_PSOTE